MQSSSKLKITDLEVDLALTLEEAENIVGGGRKRPGCPGSGGCSIYPDLTLSSAIADNPISFDLKIEE